MQISQCPSDVSEFTLQPVFAADVVAEQTPPYISLQGVILYHPLGPHP